MWMLGIQGHRQASTLPTEPPSQFLVLKKEGQEYGLGQLFNALWPLKEACEDKMTQRYSCVAQSAKDLGYKIVQNTILGSTCPLKVMSMVKNLRQKRYKAFGDIREEPKVLWDNLSVCCEYVLFPLLNKETSLAYHMAESC